MIDTGKEERKETQGVKSVYYTGDVYIQAICPAKVSIKGHYNDTIWSPGAS
jgi:hypothetical protein